jgi:hypothetical protein
MYLPEDLQAILVEEYWHYYRLRAGGREDRLASWEADRSHKL